MKRATAAVLLVSALAGGLAAAAVMYVAWQHNPQGEFHEEINGVLSIHWGDWLRVGLSWFAVVFVPLSLVGTAVVRLLPSGRGRKAAG
jgi:hypothetical protein